MFATESNESKPHGMVGILIMLAVTAAMSPIPDKVRQKVGAKSPGVAASRPTQKQTSNRTARLIDRQKSQLGIVGEQGEDVNAH